MKNAIVLMMSLFAAATLMSSCAKETMETETAAQATAVTRALGDKTPVVTAYIEVNDTNPLNTMLYRMNEKPFFDISIIFAANINASGTEPCLYLNDNVTEILKDNAKYVQPIREDGGKVLLSILGNHQGVGVGNLSEANQEKFAEILAWAVEEYGLDGIDFDDEWSKYGENSNFPSSVSGSFSGLVLKLREKLDARFPGDHKLITVFDYGYASSLSAAAVAACDYGWYAHFGANAFVTSSLWPAAKWSAQALNLNNNYNVLTLNQIKNRSAQSATQGMGAIMTYDLRIASQRDPLNALNKIAEGAFGGTVTRASSPANGYAKDWATGGAGTTITYADVQ